MSRLPRRMIEELEDGEARSMLESALSELPPRARVLAAYERALPAAPLAAPPAGSRWPKGLMLTCALFMSLSFVGDRVASLPSTAPAVAPPIERAASPLPSVTGEPPLTPTLPALSVAELPDAPPPPSPVLVKQEPSDLLREANRLRASSRWEDATVKYHAIIERSPRAPEVYPALVGLGDVELVRGRADAALAAFDRAIAFAPQGMLAEEARWGRARSLRVLGRPDEERSTLRELTALYPDTPLGQLATQRLEQLAP